MLFNHILSSALRAAAITPRYGGAPQEAGPARHRREARSARRGGVLAAVVVPAQADHLAAILAALLAHRALVIALAAGQPPRARPGRHSGRLGHFSHDRHSPIENGRPAPNWLAQHPQTLPAPTDTTEHLRQLPQQHGPPLSVSSAKPALDLDDNHCRNPISGFRIGRVVSSCRDTPEFFDGVQVLGPVLDQHVSPTLPWRADYLQDADSPAFGVTAARCRRAPHVIDGEDDVGHLGRSGPLQRVRVHGRKHSIAGGTCVGKIVTVEYVDDLDDVPVDAGSVDTVEFSYRGDTYSLILTAANGAQFDKDIARYIKAAKKAAIREARGARNDDRRTPAQSAKPKSRPRPLATARTAAPVVKPSGRERTRAIREWATANGHNVSARGRIAATVIEAYDAAH